MANYQAPAPIPGPEAFEERGKDAQMSQAAFVLAAGAGVGGHAERIPSSEQFPLPQLEPLERQRRMKPERAMHYLDVEPKEMLEQPDLRIPSDASAPLARDLYDKPDPVRAASLIEACLHSPSRLVRTAAAASALDTTGPREDLMAILDESAGHRDELIRDLARTALARVDPNHPRLQRLRGRQAELGRGRGKSHTAVITHGTFASRSRWWKPGGDFYTYLDDLTPSLDVHDTSYQWTGNYSHEDRDADAALLFDWIADQGLDTPDFFAHSHGGTVAHLATHKEARFDRLILLAWPVHEKWFPKFANVRMIIDVRVRFDLVIMADRGGQRFKVQGRRPAKVKEHVNGWFSHSDPHEPGYWEKNDLPTALLV